jgi:hypothetical protein
VPVAFRPACRPVPVNCDSPGRMTTAWDATRWRAALAELDRLLPLTPLERQIRLMVLARCNPGLAADVAALLDEQRLADADHFLEDDGTVGPPRGGTC